MPRESGLSSDPACAEPDNRCADTRTANKFATPLVFGGMERVPIVVEMVH